MGSKQQLQSPVRKQELTITDVKPSVEMQLISIERLVSPQSQPRRYFDEEAMAQLTASIKENGILQPLLVRPVGDKYEVVAGERRLKAAQVVGLTEVPVTVRFLSDRQASEYALIENLQRQDLNPVEETEGILQLLMLNLNMDQSEVISLLNKIANKKRGLTDNVVSSEEEVVEKTFKKVGRLSPESFRTHRIPLLKLPEEILGSLRQGHIEYTKAKAIAKLKTPPVREALLEEAIASSLSLSEIKKRIKAELLPIEDNTLQSRMEAIPKKMKKLKAWEDPDKRSKIETLLVELEALLSSE